MARPAGHARAPALARAPRAEVVRPWHTPVDFRATAPAESAYGRDLRARALARTTPARPACTASTSPTRGAPAFSRTANYKLQVEATDLAGNTGTRTQAFTLANNV